MLLDFVLFAFVRVCYVTLPYQYVIEIVSLNNSWLCHSICGMVSTVGGLANYAICRKE
jgi:hypothetical protein